MNFLQTVCINNNSEIMDSDYWMEVLREMEKDINITKNGKNIATLTSGKEAKRTALYSLVGIAKDLNGMDIKEARLSRQ